MKWRDDAARKHNVPRSFVFKDEVLDKIAYNNPHDIESLEKCGFKTRISRENIKLEIINLLNNKTEKTNSEVANKEPKIVFKLSDAQKEIYQKSRIILQEQAEKFSVSPELIINQSNLQHIISGYKSIDKILPSWRYIVFGAELEKLIT